MAISKKTISKTLKAQRSQTPGAFTVDVGNPFTLKLTLADGELYDGSENVYCEFHEVQFPTDDAPVASVVLPALTGALATFDFTSAQMNQPMESAEKALWLVAFVTWADGREEVLWRANVTMNAHHASTLAGAAPSATWAADSRYRRLAVAVPQADVSGLVAALAGKAAASHTHVMANVTDLAAALALLAPLNNAALTGNPTAPTQAALNSSTRLATTAFVMGEKASVLTALYDHAAENDADFAAIIDALALKAPLAAPTFQGAVIVGTGGPGGGNSLSIGVNTPTTFNGLTTWAASATFAYADGTVSGLHRAALGFQTLSDYVTLTGSQILSNKVLDAPAIKNGFGVFNPGNTFAYTLTPAAIAGNYALNLPLITGADTLAVLGLAQTFTAQQTFTTPLVKTSLAINNPANTFAYTLTPAAIAANRILNLPLITATDTLAVLGLAQTFTAQQTFTTPLVKTSLAINNPADTFAYTITPAAIAANRILNLPLITGTDTLATLGLVQTFSAANTFSVSGSTGVPAVKLSGAWLTSSAAASPQFLINDPTNTTFAGSTSGTGLAVNSSTAFVGNLIDAQANAVWKFRVSYTGAVSTPTSVDSPLYYGAGLSNGILRMDGNTSARGLGIGSLNLIAWSSGSYTGGSVSGDTMIGRKAAANLQQGAADNGAPVAQTFSVQSVSGGTPNATGPDRTYSASQGTGTGVGGAHIFTVAPAGGAGSSQNALVEAVRITGAGVWAASLGAVVGATSLTSCALLEVVSTSKGFLLPKHTTTQRDAVASPVAGLAVYNTTTNKLNFYNGSAWEAVTSA